MSIKDYSFSLAAGARTEIEGPIKSIRLMSSTGAIVLDVNNNKSTLVAGRAVIFDTPIEAAAIINEGGATVTGILAIGSTATVSDNILSGTVDTVKPSTVSTAADAISLPATTTLLLAADTARRAAIISNLDTNTAAARIGDSSTAVNRGAQVGVGQSITLEGSAAIYAYIGPGGVFGITTIKD